MELMNIRRKLLMGMGQGKRVYSGTVKIIQGDADLDISVSLPSAPIFVVVEPMFTPTYGRNSTLGYMIYKCEELDATAMATGDSKKFMAIVSEGRSTTQDSGFLLAYAYANVLDNIVLEATRIKLGLRNRVSFPWQTGTYKWQAFC